MPGTYITINQYTTGGAATGHVNFTVHYGNGTTTTYGKNWNGLVSNPQGGWYVENNYVSGSPPTGVTLVNTSGPIDVSDANVPTMQSWLSQQVAGGPGTEPYALALMNCVDGVNEILAKFTDTTLDASAFMINNGTLVFNYARTVHNGAANLDSNGHPIITVPMYLVNPDSGVAMPSWWEPVYDPNKTVTVEPVQGLNGLYTSQTSVSDGSHITNTDDPDWDGWWIYSGTYGDGGSHASPVPPDVPSID